MEAVRNTVVKMMAEFQTIRISYNIFYGKLMGFKIMVDRIQSLEENEDKSLQFYIKSFNYEACCNYLEIESQRVDFLGVFVLDLDFAVQMIFVTNISLLLLEI